MTENNVDALTEAARPGGEGKGEVQPPPEGARRRDLAIAMLTAAVILAVYLLRVDDVVGQFMDDGWYVILAKSLATGHGYNLINLPQHSGLYFYPPLFPFLLSLLYRVSPEFPGNVLLLKSLSIAAMLLLPVLVFRFFERKDRLPRSLAYAVAFATAVAPSLVLLATSSMMSECVFTTLEFATLLFAERLMRSQQNGAGVGTALAAGLQAAASVLTRTIGIALLPAIAFDLLKRRTFKLLAVLLATVTLCVAPWIAYRHLRASSSAGSEPMFAGYSAQFWDRLAGSYANIKVTPRDLPARFWQTSTVIVGDDVGGMLVSALYRSGSESGQELLDMTAVIPRISRNAIGLPGATMGLNVSGQLISLGFSILVLIGFVASARRAVGPMELFFGLSLLIIIAWPWAPIRFLAPLVPFLLYYLLVGIATIYRMLLRRFGGASRLDPWAPSRVVMLCILGLFLYDHAGYVVAKHKGTGSLEYPPWVRQFDANKKAAEWVRQHTAENEIVSGGNPSFVYLYSGRQTALCSFAQCVKMGIRYYVNTADAEVTVPAKVVFRSEYHGVEVLEFERK